MRSDGCPETADDPFPHDAPPIGAERGIAMSRRIPYAAIIAALLAALAMTVAAFASLTASDASGTTASASSSVPVLEAHDMPVPQDMAAGDAATAGAAASESISQVDPEDAGDAGSNWEEQDVVYAEDGYYASAGEYYADDYGAQNAYGGSRIAYDPMYNADGPDPQMPGWYGGEEDGYVETYYSSNVLYHSMTDQWTVDDEGFYRDANGRYVIGVSDSERDELPYGSVVMTGKGEAVVYDYGSGIDNVHDFYTNW